MSKVKGGPFKEVCVYRPRCGEMHFDGTAHRDQHVASRANSHGQACQERVSYQSAAVHEMEEGLC